MGEKLGRVGEKLGRWEEREVMGSLVERREMGRGRGGQSKVMGS